MSEVLLRRLCPAILAGITLVNAIIGCAAPLMQRTAGSYTENINILTISFLYNGISQSYSIDEFHCHTFRSLMKLAAAFGIIGCILAAVATILAAVCPFRSQISFLAQFPKVPKFVVVLLLAVVAFAMLVAWVVVLIVYVTPLCGSDSSYSSEDYGLNAGFACFLIANCFAVGATVATNAIGVQDPVESSEESPIYYTV